MKKKDFKSVDGDKIKKIDWEAPKLICLDKGKTEGGNNVSYTEDTEGTIS